MIVVYRTYDSLEAGSIIKVLHDNGIQSTVERKDEFIITTGITRICFEIYVAEDMLQQALQLLSQNDSKHDENQKNSKKDILKKIYVIFIMIMLLIVFLLIFLDSFGVI